MSESEFQKNLNQLAKAKLYGILDLGYTSTIDATRVIREMMAGGVDILQLRAKKHRAKDLKSLACDLASLTKEAGVPFIINDHPELARDVDACGVHVGQDDLSVAEVRRQIGPYKIVGLSTHSLSQARNAQNAGDQAPNYIGFGPLFATPTKPDYTPIGTQEIQSVHKEVMLPIFCIGGIKLENLQEVLKAGAQRVVIVSGILQADDIAEYCRSCAKLLKN